MHVVDPYALTLAYRVLHLAGMAFLLGGSMALAAHAGSGAAVHAGSGTGIDASRLLQSAVAFERGFWIVAAFQVLTGLGNAGMLGAAPGPETRWGVALTVKLALVLTALVASLLRSSVVAALAAEPDRALTPNGVRGLRGAYVATAIALGAVVVMAVRLAHG